MAVNKVVYGGETVIDLTNDSVTPDKMLLGVTAHNKSGARITGTLTPQEKTVDITENGTKEVIADEGYLLSKVIINTDIKQKYCLVRFYNDDRTTLLYETFVPYGGNAVYAGDAPNSTNEGRWSFAGFEPSSAIVIEDMNCYATYEELLILEDLSWAEIAAYSEAGTAQNYLTLGDTKRVILNGTVGTETYDPSYVSNNYYVYIIGFNHNSEVEGTGIHFGTFKAADGRDWCLYELAPGTSSTNGSIRFNMNHSSNSNGGGWDACNLRYDILGSTDTAPSTHTVGSVIRYGYDASPTCATNPVANTLMAALPAELRAVMKPMTKYTDNRGLGLNTEDKVTATIDYLPLLAEFEIFGVRKVANSYEYTKQAQYAYYAEGNSKIKYRQTGVAQIWWTRSSHYNSSSMWVTVATSGAVSAGAAQNYYGLAPIFKV